MKDSKISLQLRLDSKTHEKLKKIASLEIRSLNSQLEYFLLKSIEDYEKQNSIILDSQND